LGINHNRRPSFDRYPNDVTSRLKSPNSIKGQKEVTFFLLLRTNRQTDRVKDCMGIIAALAEWSADQYSKIKLLNYVQLSSVQRSVACKPGISGINPKFFFFLGGGVTRGFFKGGSIAPPHLPVTPRIDATARNPILGSIKHLLHYVSDQS